MKPWKRKKLWVFDDSRDEVRRSEVYFFPLFLIPPETRGPLPAALAASSLKYKNMSEI